VRQITTYVDFPIVGLDLSEHTVNPVHVADLYDLFAVSNHMGGLGGGQLTAAQSSTSNGWHAYQLLITVVSCAGLLCAGHYNAYVRNHTDGCWYLHDDSSVSRVRHLSDIKSSSAYVLFYQRRARGAQVPSEAQIADDIKAYHAALPKTSYGASSSYGLSYSSTSDLD
jgi:ubiquitin carboxyl-terminal hydrolase 4/11/15